VEIEVPLKPKIQLKTG